LVGKKMEKNKTGYKKGVGITASLKTWRAAIFDQREFEFGKRLGGGSTKPKTLRQSSWVKEGKNAQKRQVL